MWEGNCGRSADIAVVMGAAGAFIDADCRTGHGFKGVDAEVRRAKDLEFQA